MKVPQSKCHREPSLSDVHVDEEQNLDIAKVVDAVYGNICSQETVAEDSNALNILTGISRKYPDIANELLLHKLLDKVISFRHYVLQFNDS